MLSYEPEAPLPCTQKRKKGKNRRKEKKSLNLFSVIEDVLLLSPLSMFNADEPLYCCQKCKL